MIRHTFNYASFKHSLSTSCKILKWNEVIICHWNMNKYQIVALTMFIWSLITDGKFQWALKFVIEWPRNLVRSSTLTHWTLNIEHWTLTLLLNTTWNLFYWTDFDEIQFLWKLWLAPLDALNIELWTLNIDAVTKYNIKSVLLNRFRRNINSYESYD